MQATDDLQETIRRYENYAEVDPQNHHLALQLGDLYHRAGSFAAAVVCFERCLLMQPGFAPARSRLAAVMLSQQQFSDAERLLRALIDEGDSHPALRHNLGVALYYQGHWSAAGECFAAAAAAGLDDPSNAAYLARSLHQLGMLGQAIDACHRWHAAAPGADSQSYLALLYMDKGEADTAATLAAQVLARDPDHGIANLVGGSLALERQQFDQAARQLEQALRRDNGDGRAWQGLGLVRLQRQEFAPAIAALERAVQIFPDGVGNWVTLGWARYGARDLAGAEQAFRQAIAVNRSFGEAHGGLAVVLASHGKMADAEEAIKLAERLSPSGFGAEFARVVVQAGSGDQATASATMQALLQRSPKPGMPALLVHVQQALLAKRDAGRH